jgi:hypothetical protein
MDDTEPLVLSDELIDALLSGYSPEDVQTLVDYEMTAIAEAAAAIPPPAKPARRHAPPAKPRPASALSKLTGEWKPVPITLRDPAFMSRIKLAGVGNQCAHWQPFCLVAHWRRSCNIARESRSPQPYPCPVTGCNRSINFDLVVLFDDLSQGQERPSPMPADVDDALLVRKPIMVSTSMRPVAPDAAKRGLTDRSLIGAASGDTDLEEGALDPVEDPQTLKRRQMLKEALEHPPDFWRERYCSERDALKKLRRRALRANEQLNIMLADNVELRAMLKERVAAVEAMQSSSTIPTPPPPAVPVPRQVLSEARSVAHKKKTQLEYAIAREVSAKKPMGGAQASYDRRLLSALWQAFVEHTEAHFVCVDEEGGEEEEPETKRRRRKKKKESDH